jgi:hypothetical protein
MDMKRMNPTLVNKGNASTSHIERKKTKREREREKLGRYSPCFIEEKRR